MPNPPQADSLEWTVLRVLQWATGYLKGRGVESPRAAAELLLSHVLGTERVQLYVRYDQPLVPAELAAFKEGIRRRLRHEPVAYIVGRKGFWTLDLRVSPEVLIPRPETELLVEQALSVLRAHPAGCPARVLELGVGSGAVLLALAMEAGAQRFFGCDIAAGAVALARANALAAGVGERVSLWAGDWFAGLNAKGGFDLIVSNPPYVRSAEIDRLQPEITAYEPRIALDGGPDGLRSYRSILSAAHGQLVTGGSLILEIGSDQRAAVLQLAEETGRYVPAQCRRDYSGHDRVITWRKK
jgi:release factor glutamine methyltransferase